MFQKSVESVIPAGLIGELALHGHVRAQPARLDSADASQNVVGRAFTVKEGGTGQPLAGDNGANPHTLIVQAGGAGAFAGILFHPKVYAQAKLTADALGPLSNGVIVELCQEAAGLFIAVPAPAKVGDLVYFLTDGGELLTAAADAPAPAGADKTPIGRIERFDVKTAGGGLANAYIGPVSRASA